MTYRERREAKAARLREWAEKRQQKADAGFRVGEDLRGDTAFWTQPGRIPERDRIHRAHERAFEHAEKAQQMQARATGIEAQAAHAIYSDDEDAAERLEVRIAELEQERDRKKYINAEIRKGPRWSDRISPPLTDTERRELETWASMGRLGFGDISNITASIKHNRDRLAALRAERGTKTS